MSQMCAADVLAYDYCGYGFSEGSPSEETCVESIEAAYAYLLKQFTPNRTWFAVETSTISPLSCDFGAVLGRVGPT